MNKLYPPILAIGILIALTAVAKPAHCACAVIEGSECVASVTPEGAHFGYEGGEGVMDIETKNPVWEDCYWNTAALDKWIRIDTT